MVWTIASNKSGSNAVRHACFIEACYYITQFVIAHCSVLGLVCNVLVIIKLARLYGVLSPAKFFSGP